MVPKAKTKHAEGSILANIRPALGIEFSLNLDKGTIKSTAWPTGEEREYALPPLWGATDEHILYWGLKSELPDFLPTYKIPLPRAWFDVLFKERSQSKRKIYMDDAYCIETGYIVYDRREAYEAEYWSEAMATLGFAV